MKKAVIALALLICFLCGTLFAQNAHRFHFDLGGGLSILQTPEVVNDDWKDGPCIGIGFGYDVFPILSVGIIGEYNHFSQSLSIIARDQLGDEIGNIEVEGGDRTIWACWIVGRLNIITEETGFRPYAVGGFGYAYYKVDDLTTTYQGDKLTTEGGSDSDFSTTLGVGLEMKFNPNFAAFCEGRYVIIFADLFENENYNYIPIKAGVRFYL